MQAYRFRSKVAEALFNKYAQVGDIAQSRGIKHDLPYVAPLVKKILKEKDIDVDGTPRFVDENPEILEWADGIIIVADNVYPSGFPKENVDVWPIKYCGQDDEKTIRLRVTEIESRVNELISITRKRH
mgnify:CR=1 FL=1